MKISRVSHYPAALMTRLAELHATGPDRPWSAEEVTALCRADCNQLYILEKETHPIAFTLLQVTKEEAEILTITIHPNQRKQGLGTQLLAYAIETLKQNNILHIWLEVAADNPAAQQLYHKTGFRQTGTRPGYYKRESAHSADAWIMHKPLT